MNGCTTNQWEVAELNELWKTRSRKVQDRFSGGLKYVCETD